MPFGMEKLERLGYPAVKKLKIGLLVLSKSTNVTNTHGRTETSHDDIGSAYIASRGNNRKFTNFREFQNLERILNFYSFILIFAFCKLRQTSAPGINVTSYNQSDC